MAGTWQPVDLDECQEVNELNLLEAVADGRAYITDDPDNPGCILYDYTLEDDPDDSAGPFADEMTSLIRQRFVTDDDETLTLTELGRKELDDRLYFLEILLAVSQGRVHANGSTDRAGRALYDYEPVESDHFEGKSFSIEPFLEDGWVETYDNGKYTAITALGWHRLGVFGL